MRKTVIALFTVLALALIACCAAAETTEIRLLTTSDLHGMFCSWDYALDEPFPDGGLTRVASAVAALRDDNTLVLDAGDTIQDNSEELFVEDGVNPMIAAMNRIGYDAVTTGNHEYNYGMDVLRRILSQQEAEVLTGNVRYRDGSPVGKSWVVFERGGVRIGVIGMVTPNILHWDADHLEGCAVSNPIGACRKAIEELRGKADILVGLMHMDLADEYGTPGSGAVSLAEACPELDVILAAHGHQAIPGETRNGVLITENLNQGQTLSEVILTVEKNGDGCSVTDKTSRLIKIADYPEDESLKEFLQPWHERAVENAHMEIGRLEGGDLAPANEISFVPQAMIEDTALLDLINNVQLYYSGAKVTATSLTNVKSALPEGPIRNCDISLIYRYENTLYTLEMNGKQLRQFMEWAVRIYQTWREGDLILAFDPDIPYYQLDVFAGVNYEVDVSRPVGDRIRNLAWPDGTPVADGDHFVIAVNNYRANSALLTPGMVFAEGEELPLLLEKDVHGSDIGNVRAMIADYIRRVKGGRITPDLEDNWKLVGADWDGALHAEAVRRINEGSLQPDMANARNGLNTSPVTVGDLK